MALRRRICCRTGRKSRTAQHHGDTVLSLPFSPSYHRLLMSVSTSSTSYDGSFLGSSQARTMHTTVICKRLGGEADAAQHIHNGDTSDGAEDDLMSMMMAGSSSLPPSLDGAAAATPSPLLSMSSSLFRNAAQSQSRETKQHQKHRNQTNGHAATQTASASPAKEEEDGKGMEEESAGDSFEQQASRRKKARREETSISKMRRQLQYLAAKEMELEKQLKKEERNARKKKMAFVTGADKKKKSNADDGDGDDSSKTHGDAQQERLREAYERFKKKRVDFNTIPDDLAEMLPSNEALETAMAFSILSQKDARADLSLVHTLLKSNLLSLASPVGWWDPYDVKPQAFAFNDYAALPVFTSIAHLQHFCHMYRYAVRDPSGTLWADGNDVKYDAPKLEAPKPWSDGGGVDGDSGASADPLSSSSTAVSMPFNSVQEAILSAASILGRDRVKARRAEKEKEEAERKRRAEEEVEAATTRAAQQGHAEVSVSGSSEAAAKDGDDGTIKPNTYFDPSAPPSTRNNAGVKKPIVIDRVLARKFEETIAEGNAAISADAFFDDLMMATDGKEEEKDVRSDDVKKMGEDVSSFSSAAAGVDSADISNQTVAGGNDGDDGEIDMLFSGLSEDGAAATTTTRSDDPSSSSSTKTQDGSTTTSSEKKQRREEARRRKAEAAAEQRRAKEEAERKFKEASEQRAKEDAKNRAELWAALEATPKTLKGSTVVTPLITYGPFIRPYFVGYYADFKTLLHNLSIVPKMVDIIINPCSPTETIISRTAAKEAITNESLLKMAYHRVEQQLKTEFHNFFLAYCEQGEVQSARCICMPQPTPETAKEEDSLYDITIMVDCLDFDKLLLKLKKAKRRGILKGHSSLHVVPMAEAPEFMIEGSTVFFECEEAFKRPEYTPVDFYADPPPSSEKSNDNAMGGNSDGQQQQQRRPNNKWDHSGTQGSDTSTNTSSSSSSSSKTNVHANPIDPVTQQMLDALHKHREQTAAASTSPHRLASKKVGKFRQLGVHATISTRIVNGSASASSSHVGDGKITSDSIYSDPSNQSTEAHSIASNRFRLGVGLEQ